MGEAVSTAALTVENFIVIVTVIVILNVIIIIIVFSRWRILGRSSQNLAASFASSSPSR